MKSPKSYVVLAALAALTALPCLATAATGADASEPSAGHAASYGEALTLEATTPIADIVADPRGFDGRRVRVTGEVEGVCPMKGCWMNLRQGDAVVQIKVEDDVIVFPADAVGDEATAEGVVELLEMSRDEYVAWQRHLAEELDRDFDPQSVGDGPYEIVRIKGLGAEIERPSTPRPPRAPG
jgi:hypothetical protein